MQFSDTTNKNGIIQDCERLCSLGDAGISGQPTLLKQFTAQVNNTVSRLWSLIFQAYGGWIYDDSNNTDLPQAYTNLVAGQRRYSLPSYALSILRVDVTDSGGLVRRLTPVPQEVIDIGIADFMQDEGPPQFYRLMDGELELYPASLVAVTDGLEIFFERDSVQFVSTDTTRTPGFASPFHYLVPIGASIDHLRSKQASSAVLKELKEDMEKGEAKMTAYYNKRWRDLRPKISTPLTDWR
jgi:hypothetical protein